MKLSRADLQEWRSMCRVIRTRYPLSCPVSFRVNLPESSGLHASCTHYYDRLGRPSRVVIRFGPWLNLWQRKDALCHEYAHALNANMHGLDSASEHDECWGVLYARCYRALTDE